MIDGGELRPICRSLLSVLNLRRNGSEATFVQDCYFSSGRPGLHPAGAAVVTDPGYVDICNSVVIDIVNNCRIDIVNGAIIGERTSVPITSLIAVPHIAMAVIDPAIETDVRSPISVMPAIAAAAIGPIGRRPETADVRGDHPRARDPIVPGGSVSPVAGCPYVIVTGAWGLLVLG